MSPLTQGRVCVLRGFPRVSGDEPGVGRDDPQLIQFSPRERG